MPYLSQSQFFFNEEFAGIARWIIETTTLSKHFLEPIKIGNSGYAWMFDDRNIVLSHPKKDFVGMSVLDVIKKMHKERGEIFDESRTKEHIRDEHDYLNRVKTEEEGCGIFINCATDENDIVAYKKVSIGKATLNLIMTSPYTEIAGPIYEHEKNTLFLAGLVVLLFSWGGVLHFRSEKRKSELKAERKNLMKIAESAEALRVSEEKLSGIIGSIIDRMSMMDDQYNIVWANDVAKELFGPDLVGKKCYEAYYKHDKHCEPCVARKCFENGKFHMQETEVIGASGNPMTFWCTASVAARDKDGQPKMVVEVSRDITERKRVKEQKRKLEAQLQHAQKMESIGTLTSGVAHNFRNMLSPISLYSQLIQSMYKDDIKLKEMAEKTEECVKRGTQLVNRLMQFSRKHAKELKTINVAEVIRETYDLITKSFDKKIDIRMDIADSLPIKGDHSGLSQVFMNLCTNARDAMPDGGELCIEAGMEGDNLLISISDTGHGMDEQTREQCFDPFFTTKEVDKGTGLGLSTAYGIVKDLGGEIRVFSELNKGTTFKLYFPLAHSDEHQRQAGLPEIVQGNGEKVLIVDDEAEILDAMVMLTERLGYRAAFTVSGKAGIEKYKSWRPEVVLMDRNMPEMDGLRCAQSILEYDPEARIVLISGYDVGGTSGIDDKTKALIKWYLTKPVSMEELSQTIRKVL